VAAGGTLIGIGNAVAYMADPRAALISIQQESAPRPVDAKKPEAPKPEAGQARVPGKLLATEDGFSKAIQADTELPDRALGVMLRARLDSDHWMTAGAGESVNGAS
jgi:hypothetical protein